MKVHEFETILSRHNTEVDEAILAGALAGLFFDCHSQKYRIHGENNRRKLAIEI